MAKDQVSKARLLPALGAGFSLIFSRPLSVLVWGLISFLCVAAPILLIFLLIAGATDWLNPEIGNFTSSYVVFGLVALAFILIPLGALVANSFVAPAIYRAVLDPVGERRAFYLRFSRDEWRMAVLTLLFGVAFIGVWIIEQVVSTVLQITLMGGSMAVGFGNESAALVSVVLAMIFMIVFGIAMMLATVYVFARLWMAAPITIAEDDLTITGGWALTRGYGWKLTGMYVVLTVINFLMYLIVLVIAVAVAAIFAGGNLDFARPGPELAGGTGPIFQGALILGVIFWFLLIGVFQVVNIAPWAAAYQAIAGKTGRSSAKVFD